MKHLTYIPFIFLAACSSQRHIAAPAFNKEVTCSAESQAYLKKYPKPKGSISEEKNEEIRAKLLSMTPEIRNCLNQDSAMVPVHRDFNLCLVTGFDINGKQEYFNFSTNEISLTPTLSDCLQKLSSLNTLKGLKNLSIVQPIHMKIGN